MKAGCICARGVDTARAHENVWMAAERMHQRCIGSLVVVNHLEEPIGIVTDRDLVERVLAKELEPHETLIGEVMTPDPKTVAADATVESMIAIMQRGCFRRLPVVDRAGKLIGLVSLDDILMRWAKHFCQIGQLLAEETPRGIAEEVGFGLG